MKRELIAHEDPKSHVSELFRTLRTNVQFMNSNKKLTELLLGIPVSKRTLKEEEYDLPPMMPDFEAICGVLQSWDVYRFLISSGGCDGCISGFLCRSDRGVPIPSGVLRDAC